MQSGAHCIQIFDSWGGQLPPDMWERWSRPYIEEVSWNDYGCTVVVLYVADYVKLGTVKFSYTTMISCLPYARFFTLWVSIRFISLFALLGK